MTVETKVKALRIVLIIVGLIYIFGIYAMMKLMPESWTWGPRQPEYEQMIMGIYATLGFFLLLAAQDPLSNRSLLWFTIVSNLVHGLIMVTQSILDPAELSNMWGDIPALFLIAIVLWVLMPNRAAFHGQSSPPSA
jgi:amino acid transporter